MEREANLPDKPPKSLVPSTFNQESSSSSSSSSSPELLRHLQAAFKRHRPLSKMQKSTIEPRRMVAPQRQPSRSSSSTAEGEQRPRDVVSLSHQSLAPNTLTQDTRTLASSTVTTRESTENASVTPPSVSGATDNNNNMFGESLQTVDSETSLKSEYKAFSSSLAKMGEFRSFLNQPASQCSAVGSSCATTTSIRSSSAPMFNATTQVSRFYVEADANAVSSQVLLVSSSSSSSSLNTNGMLSYMSPEAFMCNENDENGNTIKCGRPSDIWSLGCILYQMVYGRTPFADYKTFWAKFKVITDPNHEITYSQLSNPWLVDLMKKCLAWDRNERWRIPELLQHPFLAPPIPPEPRVSSSSSIQVLRHIATSFGSDDRVSELCAQLHERLRVLEGE
ncbi:hypothetical protein F2Q69_00051802 [Brassica cretica]|uniref:Protein kinase domain-containing protein n=1 Tax=Brassica cretica TaxID=69181 RepID=A0A8S9PRT7_BRACR|nr:hypothetical protein F2Q69_00051802 [Brassica cretica]